jgi:hypothetical protein
VGGLSRRPTLNRLLLRLDQAETMGILDEAIREHLELKRKHGAADPELQKLEDEAFGPPARPGEAAIAEAPPGPDEAATAIVSEPAAPPAEAAEPLPEPAPPPQEAAEPAADLEEAAAEPVEPAVEEQPAGEHRAVTPGTADEETVAAETEEHPPPEPPEVPEEAGVADAPTELYDFGGEPAAEEQAPEAPAEAEPLPEEPVEDEFFSEQSLSDELDQALDAPEAEPAPGPPEVAEPAEPEPEDERGPEEAEDDFGEAEEGEGEDVLEETPDFLQDTPEHDRLWFEQKPPKDFDFDD